MPMYRYANQVDTNSLTVWIEADKKTSLINDVHTVTYTAILPTSYKRA